MIKGQTFEICLSMVIILASPAAFASAASDDFLDIKNSKVQTAEDMISEAVLRTHGHLLEDGQEGAFGYGILNEKGLDGVIVTTTHGGVYDSKEQESASDASFHNHFVKLADEDVLPCNDGDVKVEKITQESSGDIEIDGKKAIFEDVPDRFNGKSIVPAFDKDDAEFNGRGNIKSGTDVQDVVSFTLYMETDNDNDEIEAVCVTDIKPADNVVVN